MNQGQRLSPCCWELLYYSLRGDFFFVLESLSVPTFRCHANWSDPSAEVSKHFPRPYSLPVKLYKAEFVEPFGACFKLVVKLYKFSRVVNAASQRGVSNPHADYLIIGSVAV